MNAAALSLAFFNNANTLALTLIIIVMDLNVGGKQLENLNHVSLFRHCNF